MWAVNTEEEKRQFFYSTFKCIIVINFTCLYWVSFIQFTCLPWTTIYYESSVSPSTLIWTKPKWKHEKEHIKKDGHGLLHGDRKQNDLSNVSDWGHDIFRRVKKKKKMRSHLFHFSTHLLLVYSWLVIRERQDKVGLGNSNSLWVIIRED